MALDPGILHRAVNDVGLELYLAGFFMLVLFLSGWFLREWAFRRHFQNKELSPHPRPEDQDLKKTYSANFWQGISTELFGAVVTTFCFGVVLLIIQQYQTLENRKAGLVLQMGSPNNAFAVEAARQLGAMGWLDDGTLMGAYLFGADLAGATLLYVDLQHAYLSEANLHGAYLYGADFRYAELAGVDLQDTNLLDSHLSDAYLVGADLRDAVLWGADLHGADLGHADLRDTRLSGANMRQVDLNRADLRRAWLDNVDLTDADLADANLEGTCLIATNLRGANLLNANLTGAEFSVHTILPDSDFDADTGEFSSKWTPETDMARFTDPNHPDFWRPEPDENGNLPWWASEEHVSMATQ